jgi:glycerol uptake facilitator-like aquaporin
MLSTAIFVSVILALKYHKGTGHDILDAEGISLTLYGMINFSRGISGSCLNPAVGIVQSLFTYFMFHKNYEKT